MARARRAPIGRLLRGSADGRSGRRVGRRTGVHGFVSARLSEQVGGEIAVATYERTFATGEERDSQCYRFADLTEIVRQARKERLL
jgi:hypothetical protein